MQITLDGATVDNLADWIEVSKDSIKQLRKEKLSAEDVEALIKEHFRKGAERKFSYGGGSASSDDPKSFKGMFGTPRSQDTSASWKTFNEFAGKVAMRMSDARFEKSVNESTGSSGGFAIPEEFSATAFDLALEQEIVRPRATVYGLSTPKKTVPATVLGDHSSNLYGGVTATWEGEEAPITESAPEFRSVILEPKKLAAYTRVSNEWFEDNSAVRIETMIANAISWYLDKAFLQGTGAGQPLGLLNSPALLTVNQDISENIGARDFANMWQALHPACRGNATWIIDNSRVSDLYYLDHAAFAETNMSPAYLTGGISKAPPSTIFGQPVVYTEKLPADTILLADVSQYAIGLRREIRLMASIHEHFQNDQTSFRATIRVDGESLWDEPLTLADGSSQVSPFVVLGAYQA